MDGVEVLDLLDEEADRFLELCDGVDTIVHAGFRPPAAGPSYVGERLNVD
ncbi:MAG: hypothetical protein ABI083_14430 [Lapillicoccus sp.]